VAGVSIVAALIVRHLVTGVWVGRVSVIRVCRQIHFRKTLIHPLYLMQQPCERSRQAGA